MQERAVITKDKILNASLKLFAKKGFHGTKIDEIADFAKVNKQRIYANFGNKEKLFSAVLLHSYKLLAKHEKKLLKLSEDDIYTLTEQILNENFDFHKRNPTFWRILAWSNLEESIHVDIIKGLREDVFYHLRNLYIRGQEKNIFNKSVSFESYYFFLVSVSFFYFSNIKTMSKTIDLDLNIPTIKTKIISELLLLIK